MAFKGNLCVNKFSLVRTGCLPLPLEAEDIQQNLGCDIRSSDLVMTSTNTETKTFFSSTSRNFTEQRFKRRLPSTTSTQDCKRCETSLYIVCVDCEKQSRLSGWYLYWVQERRVQWWHRNDMMVSLSLKANYKETSSLQHATTQMKGEPHWQHYEASD